MFDQTFLETAGSPRKPLSVGVSLLLQAAGLAFLAVLPLLYSPGLPSAQLRSLLLAPPPPSAPVPARTAVLTGRVPTSHRFVFHPDSVDRLARPVAKIVDVAPAPDLDIPGAIGDPNAVVSSIFGAMEGKAEAPPQIIAKPLPVKPLESKPLRLGGSVAEANLIQRVQPVYPALARSARISGTVEYTATISREGLIENLQLVRGHPLLVAAAKQAILQWRYKPTLLNGQPVEVVTNILVTFTLN